MFDTTTASYLRVASISVAIFDFLETLPAVWRFYREHYNSGRFTTSCALLILIQFTSISVLITSNVGWSVRFTHQDCLKFSSVPLIFKVCQGMVAQAVIGIRAFNLSRRSVRVGCILMMCYGFGCTLQWITTLYKRQTVVDEGPEGNCRTISTDTILGAWAYYLIAILYDIIATVIAFVYLLKYKSFTISGSVMSHLTRMMYEGLGYLTVLSASNGLNLILYLSTQNQQQDIQSAAVSIGYAVTWIMSQRLLIHLHRISPENPSRDINQVVTVSRNGNTTRATRGINHGVRSQFERKNSDFEFADRDFEHERDSELPPLHSVEVRIERTVQLQHDQLSFQRDNYRATGTSIDKDFLNPPEQIFMC